MPGSDCEPDAALLARWPWFGLEDRATGHAAAKVVKYTDRETCRASLVVMHSWYPPTPTRPVSTTPGYWHASVRHSSGEYVRGMAHNGIESFRSMLKWSCMGTFHKISPKHLQRYVNEFAWRKSIRETDTIDQIRNVTVRLKGNTLACRDLVVDNGLPSGASA